MKQIWTGSWYSGSAQGSSPQLSERQPIVLANFGLRPTVPPGSNHGYGPVFLVLCYLFQSILSSACQVVECTKSEAHDTVAMSEKVWLMDYHYRGPYML